MKVEQKGHTTIIRNTEISTNDFIIKVHENINSYKNFNIIIDLYLKEISIDILKKFKDLAIDHKNNNKSFVIVAQGIDFNKIPSYLNVVPSLLEAKDVIEMEEIERDLGF